MAIGEQLTQAYFEKNPVLVGSMASNFITASNEMLKIFKLNSTAEPEIIQTLDNINGFSLHCKENKAMALVAGGEKCAWHDLSKFVATNNPNDLLPMKELWKSSSKVTQAVFTHGGQRACIGNLGAKMVIVDISSPADNDSFGKIIGESKTQGEIIGLSYSYSLDLLTVTVADGKLFVYSLTSSEPDLKATIGSLLVDKRTILTEDMGLSDDSDEFDDSDDDSMSTDTNNTGNSKSLRKAKQKLLKFAASKPVWNPAGDRLAVPDKSFRIKLFNVDNWENPVFSLYAGPSHHKDYITSLSYSPNGKFLASISLDKVLIIWDLTTNKMVGKSILSVLGCDLSWSDDDILIIGSDSGYVLTLDAKKLIQHHSISENEEETSNKNRKGSNDIRARDNVIQNDSDDMGDDVMQSDIEENEEESDLDKPMSQDLDNFIIDDDENDTHRYRGDEEATQKRRRFDELSESTELTDFNKRARQQNELINGPSFRLNVKSGWGAALTKPFSVGSTPWEGSDRRYLTITPIGYVYTVKTQNFFKITVSFFDEQNHRNYFFDDASGYDLCSINEDGAIFATSGFRKGKSFTARIEYKDHGDRKNGTTMWIREIPLRPYEFITSLSVNGDNVFVSTNKGFVRKYNIYGRLLDITMMDCIVAVMNNESHVFTIIKRSFGSGYLFNIQNINNEYIQQEIGIPLITENEFSKDLSELPVKSMFFSSDGDPCIVRNDNLLIVLTKWRNSNSKPIWKPLLDVQEGVKRAGKGRELKAWPLGLFNDSFMFIPFRGSKNYPIFPLLSPMNVDVRIPIKYDNPSQTKATSSEDDIDRNSDNEEDGDKAEEPEEKFLRTLVLAELLSDLISNNESSDDSAIQRLQLLSLEYDKALIIQIDDACSSGDSDDAFALCKMIRDLRALHAVQRLAEAKGLAGLARRVRDLREARSAEDEGSVLYTDDM